MPLKKEIINSDKMQTNIVNNSLRKKSVSHTLLSERKREVGRQDPLTLFSLSEVGFVEERKPTEKSQSPLRRKSVFSTSQVKQYARFPNY